LSASAAPQRAPAAAHFCAALAPIGLATNDFRARLSPRAEDDALAEAMLSLPAAVGSGDSFGNRSQGAVAVAGLAEAGSNAATFPRRSRFIALQPGAGSPKKTWPLERWLAVIETLRARGADENAGTNSFRLVVILGGVELANEAWQRDFERSFPPADVVVLRSPAASMLAAALARCSLFLGHDSGPAHVAAAVGCPCVLVFGPTDPAMWAPQGEHVRAICRGDSTIDVGIDDVLRAVAPALAANRGSQIQTSSPFSPA
jgi:ADP-heptose:LPS heptosyltransferase